MKVKRKVSTDNTETLRKCSRWLKRSILWQRGYIFIVLLVYLLLSAGIRIRKRSDGYDKDSVYDRALDLSL